MKRKRLGISIVITGLLYVGLVWTFSSEYTAEVAVVKDVRLGKMTIANMSGRTRTVTIPKATSGLIQEEQEYFIQYEKKNFGRYILQGIETNL
ncbi:hypothetical protein [Paenibacillus lemnae]|uniref:Uncharacterized protein n=1 Tax=Paenibacillus lemnae TaxID=1330551 RepID=A0A848MCC9_PAELE|nr:hypothetical protein [Paenibacillus lemnae]NMO97713.1 hypothetical protein [Paenibacillus lemnae]